MFQTIPLVLLSACGGEQTATDAASDADTDSDTDADSDADTDADADSDADSDTSSAASGAGYDWAVVSLAVAGRTEGFDLDGDGTKDNALWPVRALIDPLLATALAEANSALVVQLWDVDDLSDDPSIRVGMFSASQPTDTGDGTLVAGPSVDGSGRALVSTESALSGGSYAVVLADQTLVVGDVELAASIPVHVSGQPAEATHTGLLGGAIPIEAMLSAMAALGLDTSSLEGLTALADIDTDANGEPDAISAAFRFEADAVSVR